MVDDNSNYYYPDDDNPPQPSTTFETVFYSCDVSHPCLSPTRQTWVTTSVDYAIAYTVMIVALGNLIGVVWAVDHQRGLHLTRDHLVSLGAVVGGVVMFWLALHLTLPDPNLAFGTEDFWALN